MLTTLSEPRGVSSALSLFFVTVAVVVGVLTGTQSTTTGAVVVTIMAMALFAFITPTAALVTLLILAPLVIWLRKQSFGMRYVVPGTAGGIAIAGFYWFLQRAFAWG